MNNIKQKKKKRKEIRKVLNRLRRRNAWYYQARGIKIKNE